MTQFKKIIIAPILTIIFTFIFHLLSFELETNSVNRIIQPLIFSITLVIGILFSTFRKVVIIISLILLLLMILTYLFNILDFSNWLGSLGFGMLFITIMTYLPEFIKKGYIEKF